MMMGEQQTELAAQLQSALNSRAIIEQAKGVLIGQQGISAHAAYTQLRAQARAERRKIATVSAELVRSSVRADLPPVPPAGADAGPCRRRDNPAPAKPDYHDSYCDPRR